MEAVDVGAETSLPCAALGTRGYRAVCGAGLCRKVIQ